MSHVHKFGTSTILASSNSNMYKFAGVEEGRPVTNMCYDSLALLCQAVLSNVLVIWHLDVLPASENVSSVATRFL